MANNSSIKVTNDGNSVATFNLNINGNSLLLSTADIIEAIQATPAYQTEGAAYATWVWMMENSYQLDPYSGANWQHAPYLFLNSMGFGFCDDVAQIYAQILTKMGYEARVLWIEGHVVSEVFEGGSWKIFDVDLKALYLDASMNIQGYDYILTHQDDFAENFAGSPHTSVRPESWAFENSVLDLYRSTGDNQVLPPPQTGAFTGSAALTLPVGATLTIEDAPAGLIQSLNGVPVPYLSVLKVSFGDLDNFAFDYPLMPIAITGSGTVWIDGTSYSIGSQALNARLADRSKAVTQILVDSESGDNEIVYLLNSKRFSLSSSASASLTDTNGNLSLVLAGSDGADKLADAHVMRGGDGDDILTTTANGPDRQPGGVMDGGDGNDVLEVRQGASGVGVWGNSAFEMLGGAGNDRFVLAGTQVALTASTAAVVSGGAGFDTLVWNGSYNLTQGGVQNAALGLYDGLYRKEIQLRNVEKIDLISARVTGLNLTFSAQDVAEITLGSDFDRSSLQLGLVGIGNILFLDLGDNQVDLTEWTLLGRSSVGGIEYDVLQNGTSYIGIAIVSDRTMDGTSATDTLIGFAGNDIITGNGGADTLKGMAGNDIITQVAATLNAAAGTVMDGGDGDDILTLNGSQAQTTSYIGMLGGAGNDVIRAATAQGQYIGSIQIDGGDGDDHITTGHIEGGSLGIGYIDGGDGDDDIEVLDTWNGVGVWGNANFQIRGGSGNDRFILAGTQVATQRSLALDLNGGDGFDTLVWNGSYNLTSGPRQQSPGLGLVSGQYEKMIQARNIEKIDLQSAGVAGLKLKFTPEDIATITAGSDFQQSSLGIGLTGIGKTLFLNADDNLVDVAGWAFVQDIAVDGTHYQLLNSGTTYLLLDSVANHILAERPGISGSTETDVRAAALTFADLDANESYDLAYNLASSVWSAGGAIPAATLSALASAITLARNGASINASFELLDGLVDFLGAGETLTLTYDVSVLGTGGTNFVKPITFTITGATDTPILTVDMPDLSIVTNLKPGAATGTTVVGLYAADSNVNLLDGRPPLTTSSDYAVTQQQGYTNGYNFLGGPDWFVANGISAGALAGGTIVFADGTTGKINRASNGSAALSESAYIYYQAYEPGSVWLNEQKNTNGSDTFLAAAIKLGVSDIDLQDTHRLSYALTSSIWSGGSEIPAETATALATALSLVQNGNSISADFSLADRLADFLAPGETLTLIYNVTVTDRGGASDVRPVTVTITGAADAVALTLGMPDLSIITNLKPGAPAGATVAALYAPGSSVNLIEALPPLTTLSNYVVTQQQGYTNGYNYLENGWFAANGINLAALTGGTIVFADGTTGKINRASNGATGESAYIFYQAYEPGHAWLSEKPNTNGSNERIVAAVELTAISDLSALGSMSYSLASASWSGGSIIPEETASALAAALALNRNGNTITANFGLADNLVDFLAAGETLTLTYNVTIGGQGAGTATKPVIFTIKGTADAPTLIFEIPDLNVATNLKPGAVAGATVVGLYAADSNVNLLDGRPPLTTSSDYAVTQQQGYTNGYNFLGGPDWFVANGISAGALAGGTIVFADGTTGKINRASNGSAALSESAYIYYQAYESGFAWLSEQRNTSGSNELDTASVSLSLGTDLNDSYNLSFRLASSVWSGGSTIPIETANALVNALALALARNGGSITANFALADRLVDFLGAGETLTITYNVTAIDQTGRSGSKPVTFTFTGSDDMPALAAGVPDLGIDANLESGAGVGTTIMALYLPGSSNNLLDGKPSLTTLTAYAITPQPGYTNGYNFIGERNWFEANGIDIAALPGGTIVFADGTTGKINRASNGEAVLNEPAYIYYQAYEPGLARLSERSGLSGSDELDIASISLDLGNDFGDSYSLGSSFVSAVWNGGSVIPAETAGALADALSLARSGNAITASLGLPDRLVDFLGAGETLTITYDVTVTDQAGASASRPVTFTFTGASEETTAAATAEFLLPQDIARDMGDDMTGGIPAGNRMTPDNQDPHPTANAGSARMDRLLASMIQDMNMFAVAGGAETGTNWQRETARSVDFFA